ncbi:glycosyltransferase [Desulfosporosinus sp. SB140]|uniref:glycosyltransferase n=1 Tax=Desulfosporosinus paludis TaxID=3115649 RepID=UPI00388FECAB
MKVLLVNKFHYLKGGAESYYFALADGLKAEGHKVVFFSMKHEMNFPCEQSKYFVEEVDYNKKHNFLQIIKISVKLIYSFEAKKKFEELILDEKPDIIHLSNVHRQITLSVIDVAHKYDIPVVFTMHDLICACPNYVMLSPNGVCEDCLTGNYLNCVKRNCIKKSKLKSLLGVIETYFYKWRKTYYKVDFYITPSEFYRKNSFKPILRIVPLSI